MEILKTEFENVKIEAKDIGVWGGYWPEEDLLLSGRYIISHHKGSLTIECEVDKIVGADSGKDKIEVSDENDCTTWLDLSSEIEYDFESKTDSNEFAIINLDINEENIVIRLGGV